MLGFPRLAGCISMGLVGAAPALAQCSSGETLRVDSHVATYHGSIYAHGPATLLLPAWDPAGHPPGATLVGLTLRLTGRLEANVRVENTVASTSIAARWSINKTAEVEPNPMLGTGMQKVELDLHDGVRLHPYDGVYDFAGLSGESWLDLVAQDVRPLIEEYDPLVLANWIGAGDHQFVHSGAGSVFASSPVPWLVFFIDVTFGLRMELDYLWCAPEIGLPFCFGDGSGTPCPCANTGSTGAGCASSGGQGARLAASGTASVAADDLELVATELAPLRPALLFAGLNAVGSGAGAPLGDGLRCAGGDVRRLAVLEADGMGAARFGPGLIAAGGLAAGETRYFQAWYRDPLGPCGSGSNLSPGVELGLVP